MHTAAIRVIRMPPVSRLSPEEYSDRSAAAMRPAAAASRYGTSIQAGRLAPMAATGSDAEASPGSEPAMSEPVVMRTTSGMPAPPTTAAIRPADETVRGR